MKFHRPLLILLMLGSILSPGTSAVAEDPPERKKLRVMNSPYLSWAVIHLAKANGCFDDLGLDIEFVVMRGIREGLPALAQGRLDVVPGFITPGYINLMYRGANIRIVADKGHMEKEGCPYRAFLAKEELVTSGKLDNFENLRGLRIAGERTSTSYYSTSSLLAKGGLTAEDVKWIDLPTPAKQAALDAGLVDIVNASEPWVTRIVQSGAGVIWLPAREVVPDFQHSFLMFGPSLLERDRDAGMRFMVGYLRGVRIYNEGKTDHNIRVIAEETRLDEALVRDACWPPVRGTGEYDTESLLTYQAWALEEDLIDGIVPVEGFWDPSFIEYANRVLAEGN